MGDDALKIQVDQCLFGYEDGHRLLASSTALSDTSASLLLVLSDLAGGVSEQGVQSYWTGVPVLDSKVYALMRTWVAFEMPRPGCVWTHAILIPFASLTDVVDLSALCLQVVRPSPKIGFGEYCEPKVLSIRPVQHTLPSRTEALLVLKSLYGTRAHPVRMASPSDLEPAIFAAWSQQWPRLRRSFSFRTAAGEFDRSRTYPFQLRVIADLSAAPPSAMHAPETGWETTALADLLVPDGTEFRTFLWKYGGDMKRGRERFAFLAKLYAQRAPTVLSPSAARQVLDGIVETLKTPDDGRQLKLDLFTLDPPVESLLPAISASDLVHWALQRRNHYALSALLAGSASQMAKVFSNEMHFLLPSIEALLATDAAVGESLLQSIMPSLDAKTVFSKAVECPHLARKFVSANADALLDPAALVVPGSVLVGLLDAYVGPVHYIVDLAYGLLPTSDGTIVRFLLDRYEGAAYKAATRAFSEHEEQIISNVWRDELLLRAIGYLATANLAEIKSTSGLAAAARLFGLNSSAVRQAGPDIWARALANSEADDVQGSHRLVFQTFLLTLALSAPTPSTHILFEYSFDSVHAAISESKVPRDLLENVTVWLPEVSLWRRWDTCLRLRLAVANAYHKAGIADRMLARVSKHREIRSDLYRLFNKQADLVD